MTISSENRKAGPFAGNDSTTVFPFEFKVFSADDLLVVVADDATGIESDLIIDTDYAVELNEDQDSQPGGSATLTSALATGKTLVITSSIQNLQPVDLANNGGFYPKVITKAFDRITILIQQLHEAVSRSAKLPITNAEDAQSLVDDIVRLADSADNIDIAANSIDSINSAASNAAIATEQASIASSKADIAVASANAAGVSAESAAASAAAAAASYDYFHDRYLGSKTADPLVDNDGNALVEGALYWNSATGKLRLWDGANWQNAAVSGAVAETALASATGAAMVGIGGGRTQADKNAEFVSVKDFGAVGDGVADDTQAVLAGVAHIKIMGGGTLFFPQGTYKVTDEILIDSASIRFVGTGKRKVYPGLFSPTSNTVSTIMPMHSKTATVRFFNNSINTASTFSAQDINFATLETGSMPTCCFGFDGAGNFHRDYTFDRVGVHGFTSAFDTYNTGGDTAFGLFKAVNCTINRNGYIARNLTGQWNGFVFEKNEAGQNLMGGLAISAQAASIRQNSLEGQPNSIKVTGTYRGVTIAENYFELNSGDYCVQLRETSGAIIQGNYWQNITATEPLSLFACVGTKILDRVSPSCDSSFDILVQNNAINPVPRGAATAAFFLNATMIGNNMQGPAEFGGYQVTAPVGPHYAVPNSAGFIYTTSGTGLTSATKSGLSLPANTYIGVAFAVTYEGAPILPPRFDIRVNSTTTQGYTSAIFYNFNRATKPLKGETVLYFGVVRATEIVSSLQLFIYPYGLNPAAGLVCYLSAYAMYYLGTTLQSVSDVGTSIKAFIPETHIQRVSAAPIAGTWPVGYKLYARAPAAGGYEGWICTAAGTPGTWKTFGSISA